AEPPHSREAGKAGLFEKIRGARGTKKESAIGEAEPRHANADIVAQGFHTPDDLVTQHQRKLWMDELAVKHMKIRAAHAASDDFDADLVGLWPGQRQLCRAERLARPVEHHRLHRGWRHYNILRSEGRHATTCQSEW